MPITWRRTFGEESRFDFAAEEGGRPIGRIYRLTGGPQDRMWDWSATGIRHDSVTAEIRPFSGTEPTRQAAIDALLAAWERAKDWSERTRLPFEG